MRFRRAHVIPVALSLFLLLLLVPTGSRADVIYSQQADALGTVYTWTVDVPSLLTTTTSFSTFSSSVVGGPSGCTITGVSIDNPLSSSPGTETAIHNCGSLLLFGGIYTSPFSGPGTYPEPGLIMTITTNAPEPATLTLLGTGLLGLAGMTWRKKLFA